MEDRVKELGEVFTGDAEVKSILDLCEPSLSEIESRLLEPSCGTGNFLVAALDRKLAGIRKAEFSGQLREKHIIQVATTLYGVDIDPGNVRTTRSRLSKILLKFFSEARPSRLTRGYFEKTIDLVLTTNIQVGDMMAGVKDIVFIEYEFSGKSKVLRRSYQLIDMLSVESESLWGDFVPPLKEWPSVNFWELHDA